MKDVLRLADTEYIFSLNNYVSRFIFFQGASIIRMLNNFLGEEVFVEGMSYFLNSHKEGNADSDDLWFALKEVIINYLFIQ